MLSFVAGSGPCLKIRSDGAFCGPVPLAYSRRVAGVKPTDGPPQLFVIVTAIQPIHIVYLTPHLIDTQHNHSDRHDKHLHHCVIVTSGGVFKAFTVMIRGCAPRAGGTGFKVVRITLDPSAEYENVFDVL